MRKTRVVSTPMRIEDVDFDLFYEDSDEDNDTKARRIQVKRWREFKQQTF